jgi:hypothetical protein
MDGRPQGGLGGREEEVVGEVFSCNTAFLATDRDSDYIMI